MEKHFLLKQAEARVPLANIDKKGVAELYNTLGVMDTLFPITRSCEAWAKDEDVSYRKTLRRLLVVPRKILGIWKI